MKKISFPISGMHCASCAINLQKGLKNVPGVEKASVNYASENATVEGSDNVSEKSLDEKVSSLGYSAHFEVNSEEKVEKEKQKELIDLKFKVIVSGILSFFILLFTFGDIIPFIPEAFSSHILLLILATPVQFWIGKSFYLATISSLKNRTAGMDTLIIIGTSAAYFYSALVTFFPSFFTPTGETPSVYFDTASIIITLILVAYQKRLIFSRNSVVNQHLVF